ncbi:MAG: aminotransferase class IV [Pseudomonadota bacterium]
MELFLNGNYYPASESSISVFDRGFLFGDGIFTTIRVENSVPLFLSHHIKRLRSSCHFFGIELVDPDFQGIIAQLLKRNGLRNARVKIIINRGVDFNNLIYNYQAKSPTVAVIMYPLDPSPSHPIKLCISKELRGNEVIYHHKTTSYLQNLYYKTIARERGFDDCIILNWEKLVCETSTANLFVIVDQKIITPPQELPLLNGIMRQLLLSQGAIGNYLVMEDYLTENDLRKIDAAFITSAILEICPVGGVEDRVFSVEKPEAIREEWHRIKAAWLQPKKSF